MIQVAHHVRRGAPAVLMAVVLLCTSLSGCSSSATDKFCTELTKHYKLEPLITAITDHDNAAVTRNLAELRQLEDTAPKDLMADVHAVLGVMEETVRALVPAAGSDGSRAPVDRAALNLRLEAIRSNAQHITDYADRNCGMKL